jgi:hypothetical protein
MITKQAKMKYDAGRPTEVLLDVSFAQLESFEDLLNYAVSEDLQEEIVSAVNSAWNLQGRASTRNRYVASLGMTPEKLLESAKVQVNKFREKLGKSPLTGEKLEQKAQELLAAQNED